MGGGGGTWEVSVPSPQICCEYKTAKKKKKKKKRPSKHNPPKASVHMMSAIVKSPVDALVTF